MQRRTFLGLLTGGAASAMLAGCGGSHSVSKRTVRGIVLEDDGSGSAVPAGSGKKIVSTYQATPQGGVAIESSAVTDAQGQFVITVRSGNVYDLRTSGYPENATFDYYFYGPSCATVVGIVVPESNNDSLQATILSYGAGVGTALGINWTDRAKVLLSQYQALGFDVVILADLPCVAAP